MKQTLALTYRRYKLGNQKEKGLPKGVDGSPWIKMLLALDREPLGVGQQASKLTQNKHYLFASSEFHLEIQTAGGTYEANSSTHAHTAAWLLQLLLVALHSVTAHTRAHQV
jgi:hypothetical protein